MIPNEDKSQTWSGSFLDEIKEKYERDSGSLEKEAPKMDINQSVGSSLVETRPSTVVKQGTEELENLAKRKREFAKTTSSLSLAPAKKQSRIPSIVSAHQYE